MGKKKQFIFLHRKLEEYLPILIFLSKTYYLSQTRAFIVIYEAVAVGEKQVFGSEVRIERKVCQTVAFVCWRVVFRPLDQTITSSL
jgi:hypothetical protein